MNKFIIPQILFGACFVYLVVQSNLNSADTSFRTSTLTADTHFQGSSKTHQSTTTTPTEPVVTSPPSKETTPPKDDTKAQPETPAQPAKEPVQPEDDNKQPQPAKEQPSSTTPSLIQTTSNLKGDEFEPQIVYQRAKPNDTLCQQRDQKPVALCKMGLQKHCKRIQISEQLSSWWMICPMYSANVKQTGILYQLHDNFRNFAKSYGINFQTVETVFPGQEFQLTKPDNQPYDLQYKADWIFAMRENLVNVGVKHLPDDWQYMSWIDQHIFWMDPYWFEKSIWLFEHYNIVHMLNGNDFWNMKNTTDYSLVGFGYLYQQYGMGFEQHDPRQCGLAWGMRREIFEQVGGLFDLCIGTKCDLYQNYAYAGRVYNYQTNSAEYAGDIRKWQEHAIQVYDRKLGYLDSKVVHFMHCIDGCKTSDYNLQINALNRYGYSPSHDLKRDDDGRLILFNNLPLAKELWNLYGGAPKL